MVNDLVKRYRAIYDYGKQDSRVLEIEARLKAHRQPLLICAMEIFDAHQDAAMNYKALGEMKLEMDNLRKYIKRLEANKPSRGNGAAVRDKCSSSS